MKPIRIECQAAALVPPDDLVIIQGELKSLSTKAYEKLRTEIDQRGFSYAIHVWKDKRGKLCVLDGTQRLRTVQRMVQEEGYTCPKVPVVFVQAKSMKEAVRKLLAGASQYGKPESDGLYELLELNEIKLEEIQTVELTGIDLDRFADEFHREPDPKADEVPDTPKVAKTKRGELWVLGKHRLLIDDCTVKENVERLMGGEKADMAFTSPPYNLGVSVKLRGNTKIAKMGNAYVGHDDAMEEKEWLSLVSMATLNALNALNASRYAFFNLQFLAGNRTSIVEYWHAFRDKICDVMIWDKGHAPPQQAERVLNSRFEFIFIFTSDEDPCRAIRIAPAFRGTIDNVYEAPPQRQNEASDVHGATFPVHFPEQFLSNFCPINGSCLELFAGSGSTLIACEKNGRRCYGMEIEPLYGDVILERWAAYTGRDPVREDGVPWSKLKAGKPNALPGTKAAKSLTKKAAKSAR